MVQFHWYVSAYHLSFEDFGKDGANASTALCKDEEKSASMFRVVFKSNLTQVMAEDLFHRLAEIMQHVKEVEQAEAKKELGRLNDLKDLTTFVSSGEILRIRKCRVKLFANPHSAC
mmetsp:Transcript_15733/g.34031  ORF Transcript_15733/g.34031 Transcript_15733/m.34031 type:complete len:116 (+) Transcript_15733:2219-2566(+)